MRSAGASLVRLEVNWYAIAPAKRPAIWDASNPDDPNYNWSSLDTKIRLLESNGLEPLVVLNRPPLWAGGGEQPSPDVGELGKFAHAAAVRYDGRHPGLPRVRYWQIWNEPNVNVFLYPQFKNGKPYAPILYRQMVNAVAPAVHSARADDVVVAGGLSPFTVTRGATITIGPLRFMREMLCMSNGKRPRATCSASATFDVWSHHPYTSGGPTHHALNPNDVSLGDLGKMKRLLDAAFAARHVVASRGVKFWVTEISWDTDPPDRNAVPIKLQARWTSEALYRMWLLGIDTVFWLALRDSPYPSQPVQSGLWFNGGRGLQSDKPKPTLTAFDFPFVAYVQRKSTLVWGRTPASAAGRVIIERRTSHGWLSVAGLRANQYGIFTAKL